MKPQPASVEQAVALLPKQSGAAQRWLILSDLHANWPALLAVLGHAQSQACDAAYFLGDAVGYGPQPVECANFLRQGFGRSGNWVAGNHDVSLADLRHFGLDGFRADATTELVWDKHRMALQAQPELWAWWLQAITVERTKVAWHLGAAGRTAWVHANPQDLIGHYPYPDDTLNIQRYLTDLASVDEVEPKLPTWAIVGHTHMPCLLWQSPQGGAPTAQRIVYGEAREIGAAGRYWLNPGSVGQPRDGDSRAAYAVLDAGKRTITFWRVVYDITETQLAMEREHYPARFIKRLSSAETDATAQHFDRVYRRLPGEVGLEPV